MDLRRLGKTGLTVSTLGFGCGNVGGLIIRGTPAERERGVARAMELGVNYFDTAPSYGDGESERNLGQVLKANGEAAAKPVPAAAVTELPERVTNSIGMKLVLLPGGRFSMGSAPSEMERDRDEGPVHDVTITRPFYLGIYPVTQRQYEAVMGHNPSYFQGVKGGGPDFPVERASWADAVAFCRQVSELLAEKAPMRARTRLGLCSENAESRISSLTRSSVPSWGNIA